MPDDITMERLRRSKRTAAEWAAGIFMSPEPFVDETELDPGTKRPLKAPVYPMLLMVIDTQSGMIVGMPMSQEPHDYTPMFAKGLADLMVKSGKPRRILVRDERTYALLRQVCPQIGVQLKRVESVELLEEAIVEFFDHFNRARNAGDDSPGIDDKTRQLLENLEQLPSFEDMPGQMLKYLLEMLAAGVLSAKLGSMVKTEVQRREIR